MIQEETIAVSHRTVHQRSQSYAQPLDVTTPKDSTHSDNQNNTVSQQSDRRRFSKRGVRRIFARDCTFVFLINSNFTLCVGVFRLNLMGKRYEKILSTFIQEETVVLSHRTVYQ